MKRLFLAALLLSTAPLQAATVTAKFPLTNAGWTDLGAGPMLLSFTGGAVYAIADTTPAIPLSEGFTIPKGASVNLNTTSHVWAMTTGAAGANAYVAPVFASGVGVSVRIGNSGLPLIYPSSGTMANNGALTMTTALDRAYPNAYVYMPASAISAGSAAGWYYATCASTTACTLFNNAYTIGTATVPPSPAAFATTGPGAYTQTTAAPITAYKVSVPGNMLGPNGTLAYDWTATYLNSAGSKNFGQSYGAFGLGGFPVTTSHTASCRWVVSNQNATNLQMSPSQCLNGVITTNALWGAVDSTVAQNATVTINNNTATDYVVFQSVTITVTSSVN